MALTFHYISDWWSIGTLANLAPWAYVDASIMPAATLAQRFALAVPDPYDCIYHYLPSAQISGAELGIATWTSRRTWRHDPNEEHGGPIARGSQLLVRQLRNLVPHGVILTETDLLTAPSVWIEVNAQSRAGTPIQYAPATMLTPSDPLIIMDHWTLGYIYSQFQVRFEMQQIAAQDAVNIIFAHDPATLSYRVNHIETAQYLQNTWDIQAQVNQSGLRLESPPSPYMLVMHIDARFPPTRIINALELPTLPLTWWLIQNLG